MFFILAGVLLGFLLAVACTASFFLKSIETSYLHSESASENDSDVYADFTKPAGAHGVQGNDHINRAFKFTPSDATASTSGALLTVSDGETVPLIHGATARSMSHKT